MGEAVRVGIDVGGTNTDAVAIDADGVVRWRASRSRRPTIRTMASSRRWTRWRWATTSTVWRSGRRTRSTRSCNDEGCDASPCCASARPARLRSRRAPAGRSTWPPRSVGPILVARGGVEVDGRIHPLDAEEIRRFAASLDADVDAIAIVGTFSPLDAAQELRGRGDRRRPRRGLPRSMGHRIGGLGLLERENATVLNAALGDVIERVVDGLETAVARLGAARAPLPHAERRHADGSERRTRRADPHDRLGSVQQPAGRRGAHGPCRPPRRRRRRHEHRCRGAGARVPTGVGGGRDGRRRPNELPDARPRLGRGRRRHDDRRWVARRPRASGRRLRDDALVFGGSSATLTDAAVAAGRVAIGDVARVAGRDDLEPALRRSRRAGRRCDRPDAPVARRGRPRARRRWRRAVARCDPRRALARAPRARGRRQRGRRGARAGGGRGRADRRRRRRAPGRARSIAVSRRRRERAIAAGANPATLETIWVEETPLAYLDRPLSRIRAKVAGPA